MAGIRYNFQCYDFPNFQNILFIYEIKFIHISWQNAFHFDPFSTTQFLSFSLSTIFYEVFASYIYIYILLLFSTVIICIFLYFSINFQFEDEQEHSPLLEHAGIDKSNIALVVKKAILRGNKCLFYWEQSTVLIRKEENYIR